MKLLVGNKIDREDRAVAREEGEAWARSKGMLFLETSAKTTVGIKQAFTEVVQKILDNPVLLQNTAPNRNRGTVNLEGAAAEGDAPGSCC